VVGREDLPWRCLHAFGHAASDDSDLFLGELAWKVMGQAMILVQ